MSKVVITGNASGTGDFTIAAPNSNTDRTLTLPDEAGTVLTSVSSLAASNLTGSLPAISGAALTNLPASGKVLQMVNLVYSAQSSMTVGTTDTDITGMNLSITPVKSGSKFRIDVRLFGESSSAWEIVFNIHRGTTRLNTTSNLNYHGLSLMTHSYPSGGNNASTPEIMHLTTIDSTGSTAGTPITYKLVASGAVTTLWINRCFGSSGATSYETGISEIIITEIGT
jgi:hypothetical protein